MLLSLKRGDRLVTELDTPWPIDLVCGGLLVWAIVKAVTPLLLIVLLIFVIAIVRKTCIKPDAAEAAGGQEDPQTV